MIEKAQKHAWKLLFALGVVFLALGVPSLFGVHPDPIHEERILGMTLEELEASDPRGYDLFVFNVIAGGLLWVSYAVLVLVISATAYRRGERWAWYALWSLPAMIIGFITLWIKAGATLTILALVGGRGVLQEGLPFFELLLILSLLGLLLPYRKFFPKS